MSLRAELGEDASTLFERVESDLAETTEALNANTRSAMTIRGFALTAVAALVAASYASGKSAPAYAGVAAALLFAFFDLRAAARYVRTERNKKIMVSLRSEHRSLLRGRRRRRKQRIAEFKGDLHAYAEAPTLPGGSGSLRHPTEAMKVFFKEYAVLYALLAAFSLVSAVTAGGHRETIVLCRPPGGLHAAATGLDLGDCSPEARATGRHP